MMQLLLLDFFFYFAMDYQGFVEFNFYKKMTRTLRILEML